MPDLTEFPWIESSDVADADLLAEGAELVTVRRSTQVYRWYGRKVDRPEAEAVILAKRHACPLVMEDANGKKCAINVGVSVVSVASLLVELERRGHIPDAQAAASAILATNYFSRQLWWLSMGNRESVPGLSV